MPVIFNKQRKFKFSWIECGPISCHITCSDQGENFSSIAPAAGLFAMQSAERGIRCIHLSTDQVFDGTTAPSTETCAPCLIHPDGTAKAKERVRSLNPQAIIVRTSLHDDLRTPDRQSKRLIENTKNTEPYRLFTDECRGLILAENLTEALLELAKKRLCRNSSCWRARRA